MCRTTQVTDDGIKCMYFIMFMLYREITFQLFQFSETLQFFVCIFFLSVLLIVVGACVIEDFKDKLSKKWKSQLCPF